jgi:hypothetical protein
VPAKAKYCFIEQSLGGRQSSNITERGGVDSILFSLKHISFDHAYYVRIAEVLRDGSGKNMGRAGGLWRNAILGRMGLVIA